MAVFILNQILNNMVQISWITLQFVHIPPGNSWSNTWEASVCGGASQLQRNS